MLATFNSTIYACSPVVNIAHHISQGSLGSSSSPTQSFSSRQSDEHQPQFGNRQVKVTIKRVPSVRPRSIRTKVVRVKSQKKRENPNEKIKFDDDYEQVPPDMMVVTMMPKYHGMTPDSDYDEQQEGERITFMTTPKPRKLRGMMSSKQQNPFRPIMSYPNNYGTSTGWAKVNDDTDIDYRDYYQRKEDKTSRVKMTPVKSDGRKSSTEDEREDSREEQMMTSSRQRFIPSLDEALSKLESSNIQTFVQPVVN